MKTPRLVREVLSNCAGASYATEKLTPVRILIVLLGSIRAFRLKVLLSSICALRFLNVLLINRSERVRDRKRERDREREGWRERDGERERERERDRETEEIKELGEKESHRWKK